MKILYVTDLHGNINHYEQVLELAKRKDIDICINGADVLPKGGDLHSTQRIFIKEYLIKYAKKWKKEVNKPYYFTTGNDDLEFLDYNLFFTCKFHKDFRFMQNFCSYEIKSKNVVIVNYNNVKDYPFGLKNRCRLDNKNDDIDLIQYGPVYATSDGFENIMDWRAEAIKKPTIEEELKTITYDINLYKKRGYIVIFNCHVPPIGCGLDILLNGQPVGSDAVTNFILNVQPHLSLHGHIHESPMVTNKYYNYIDTTLCVQPGQEINKLHYAVIDIDENNCSIKGIKING